MNARTWILTSLSVFALVACGGHHGTTDANSGDAALDAAFVCGVFGTPCASGAACCSNVCDSTGSCTVNPTTCTQAGASCSAGTDCCTNSCIGNVCSATQCTADNGACTQDGACCGGTCSNGTCTPLNPSCKTDGNPCAGNTECCSSLCNAAGVCGPSSYCVQDTDVCAHDAECCGGICTIATGGTLGLCTHPMPGSTNCSAGIDGTVCNGCGDCCSRLCQVYAPTGVKICQPAEGCRVDGDICRADTDCCGAAGTGLPGDGHVVCLKQNTGDPTGICRNPQSCNPEGDVCHYKNYVTCGNSSARNDCCGAVGNSGVCQLDALGVPRCYGLGTMCQQTGQACAFSGDCCNGLPCVPNAQGILQCGGSVCVNTGGACTNSADCCSGTSCVFTPGQTYGTCGGGGGTCAQYGQSCTMASDCCNGIPCGIIDPTTGGYTACSAGLMGCTCSTVFL